MTAADSLKEVESEPQSLEEESWFMTAAGGCESPTVTSDAEGAAGSSSTVTTSDAEGEAGSSSTVTLSQKKGSM